MWQFVLKAEKVFKFPARASSRDFWSSYLISKEGIQVIVNQIKAADKFQNRNAALDFFGSIKDEEEFIEDKYQHLWDSGQYEVEDLAENLKLLKDTVMNMIREDTSRLQSNRATNPPRSQRMVWKRNTWNNNINSILSAIDSGETSGSEFMVNVKSMNSFIEDEPSYVKANPISSQDKKKLMVGLKGTSILNKSIVSITFTTRNIARQTTREDKVSSTETQEVDVTLVKKIIKDVLEGWDIKEEGSLLEARKEFNTDNVESDVKIIVKDLQDNFDEEQIFRSALSIVPEIKRSALAEHIGSFSQEDIIRVESKELKYRVNPIGISQVRTYIYQFLTTQYISKNVADLLPANPHGYTGSLLGEIFVKRSAGNRPRLNKYLDVLLDDSLENMSGKNFFEKYRSALKNRMFVNEDKITNEFIREMTSLFYVTKGDDDESVDSQSKKEKINLLNKNPIGLDADAKPKQVQEAIKTKLNEGGSYTEAFNKYSTELNEQINQATNGMSEPIMKFILWAIETKKISRLKRRFGWEDFKVNHIKENPSVDDGKEITIGDNTFKIFKFGDSTSRKYASEFIQSIREDSYVAKAYAQYKRDNNMKANVQENAINFLYEGRGYSSPQLKNSDVEAKYNSLSSLEKGLSAIVYGAFKDNKSLRDVFKGKVKHSAKQMDFLELIHVIANADADIGEKGRFERLWSSFDSAFNKLGKLSEEERESYIETSDEIPFIRLIKQFGNKIQSALKSIRNGLIDIVEEKLNDLVNNPDDYEKKFDRTIRDKQGRTRLQFKVYERLEQLNLISEA